MLSPLLHFYITFSETPNRIQRTRYENTDSDIAILEDVTPPFRAFKAEQKDSGWLTFFVAVNHNEI